MKLNNTFDINKLREWFYSIEIEAIPYHRYEQYNLYAYYQSALEMHKLFLSTDFVLNYNFEEFKNYNLVQKYVVAKYMYNQGIAFNPTNCYPEKHERYPNDDMWFEYKEDSDMSSIVVPDDFNAQDLTEEWWFQQNLVHDDIDLFFKMLYHNNIVKESVSFSCLYIDDLYNEIQINMPRTPVS
ncbi:hypothetical protein [Salmonella phage SD-1_S14]|nr:hypothetical protein [Salmonella phage SD-1_S14]